MLKPSIKKILITGGDGYIGSNLATHFLDLGYLVLPMVITSKKIKNEVIGDITDQAKIKNIIKQVKPDVVIHTAGLSSLAKCEKDPALADSINFGGTKNIVDALPATTKLVFFSSDYVFDGVKGNYKETDKPNPQTDYGKSKLKAEEYIHKNHKNHIILRTANVFGRGGNFFNFLVDSLTKKEAVEVFDDVSYTPTYIDFLIESIGKLIDQDFSGTIHLTGSDRVSRFEFAQKVAQFSGADLRLIKAAKQPKDGMIAKDSSLNTGKAQKLGLTSPKIDKAINYALGNIVPPYFTYKDERGVIRGIINHGRWAEINYIESKAGTARGGHYHKMATEGFYILGGEIRVRLSGECGERSFIASEGDIYFINPGLVHTFDVVSDSKWINFLSRSMNVSHPDIFTP